MESGHLCACLVGVSWHEPPFLVFLQVPEGMTNVIHLHPAWAGEEGRREAIKVSSSVHVPATGWRGTRPRQVPEAREPATTPIQLPKCHLSSLKSWRTSFPNANISVRTNAEGLSFLICKIGMKSPATQRRETMRGCSRNCQHSGWDRVCSSEVLGL